MPYSSFIPPVSKKKTDKSFSELRQNRYRHFSISCFFFQFWHHFAEKWRHKFGTEFRNLVLQGGWEEERERWERGCKFCFTLEYFKVAVFETTLYKWLLHTLGFTTRTKTPTPPLMSNPGGRNLAGVLSKIKPEVQSSPLELPTVRVVIRWNRKSKQYFEEGWKVFRWSPSDPLETHWFRWNLRKSSCAMSQNKHTASVI